MNEKPSKTGAPLVGLFVMTCGGLVAVLSGLCSLAVFDANTKDPAALVMVLLIGGLPFAAGLITFAVGVIIFRGSRPRAGPPSQPPSGSSG
ncbi:MAG TPA: hypothetical protein VG166_11725 [Caulobacteraceae bacterium]|jgi:hypothetical protein|nr:hypothetical protein [Caulobacteraceae bacterium]